MIKSAQGGDPIEQIILFNTALLYFLLLPAIIPLAIAVYSIVGEKEQTTLEPLLATPISDVELFLGKALASVIPALIVNWISFGAFLLVVRFVGGVGTTANTDRAMACRNLRPLATPGDVLGWRDNDCLLEGE